MRILITGVTGFAGSHLAEALLAREDVELFGTSRDAGWSAACGHLAGKIHFQQCDLCDTAGLERLVREVRPDQIYHLAGYAQTGQSFQEAEAAWQGNLTATRRLYDAVVQQGGQPRILFVGSGLIYGDTGREQGPDENAPLRPASPYASSKAAADLLSYQMSVAPGLDIVRVRPFNHIGPRQAPQFAVAHFAQQIAAIESGRQPAVLETGDLRPRRDLTDVRDMVRAYILLMERGGKGEVYNAASGAVYAMQEVVDRLLGLARVKIEARLRPGLVRVAENHVVRANAARLQNEIGWKPQFSLGQTLVDTLNYWREPR